MGGTYSTKQCKAVSELISIAKDIGYASIILFKGEDLALVILDRAGNIVSITKDGLKAGKLTKRHALDIANGLASLLPPHDAEANLRSIFC